MPRFQYNKPKVNHTTLIFDLDHTLVHNQNLHQPQAVEFPSAKQKHKWTFKSDLDTHTASMVERCRFPLHSSYFALHLSKHNYIIHLRPDVLSFLTFCFEHFNVAFWSAGGYKYVKAIVLHLLHTLQKQPSDILFAWARTEIDCSTSKPKFVDVFTNTSIQHKPTHMNTTGYYKDMQLVFDKFPSLSRQHTILVDNLPTHNTANIDNCCLILPPFTYLNVHDNILHKLLVRMQSLLQGSKKTKTAPCHVATTQIDRETVAYE